MILQTSTYLSIVDLGSHLTTRFERLDIYQGAVELRKSVWQLTKKFPGDERYRLSDQLIRSTRKCGANIAEGHGRYHWQENIQFCRIARGSLTESQDHINVAEECGYISTAERNELKSQIEGLIKRVNGFIRYLERMKHNGIKDG